MAKNDNLTDFVTDIADAIRAKKGTEDKINPQDFSTEIASIETDSPFAVDFGEEIATMDSYTLDSLREDIDYYNEIQRKRLNGEVTDDELLNDQEFKERIAWWPKGMKEVQLNGFRNLRFVNFTTKQSFPQRCPKLERYQGIVSGATLGEGSFSFTGIQEISTFDEDKDTATIIDNTALTSIYYCCRYQPIKKAKLYLPNVTNAEYAFVGHTTLEELYIDMPKVTSLNYFCRGGNCKKIYANIPSVRTISTSFDILYSIIELHIVGLAASLRIKNTPIQLESIKFILDNCQAREDGTAYTLAINDASLTAFLAKCDEDAEYAASLASANAKGLTLA